MKYNIVNQDAFEAMAGMPDASFDACFCDPPYGIGFMGKGWDHGVPPEVVWAELLRVLKPGAFLIAFGGTRTYHRLTCAIEDAGFEIRDCLMWLYGTGFPKSHNVSKALDKAGGISPERQAKTLKRRREGDGVSREKLAEIVGCTESSIRDWEEGRARRRGAPLEFMVPSEAYRKKLADYLGYSSDERTQAGLTADRRGDESCYGLGHSGNLTGGPTTPLAKQFDGYGTALKPAWEPCILAMKPLNGTFANNATTHGVAGLNIDGCRVPTEEQALGRWPANVIHDGCEEVTGDSFPASRTGSPSRFFYCAKASKAEKNAGCESLPVKQTKGDGGMNNTPDDVCGKYGSVKAAASNSHPTVKPLALCKYLATLILPPATRARKIIVPFSGSGSEMLGAAEAGWEDITGIESDTESGYITIAEARLKHYEENLGEKV